MSARRGSVSRCAASERRPADRNGPAHKPKRTLRSGQKQGSAVVENGVTTDATMNALFCAGVTHGLIEGLSSGLSTVEQQCKMDGCRRQLQFRRPGNASKDPEISRCPKMSANPKTRRPQSLILTVYRMSSVQHPARSGCDFNHRTLSDLLWRKTSK